MLKAKNQRLMRPVLDGRLAARLFLLSIFCTLNLTANAQLLRKNEYGVGVTVAIYQFEEGRSKKFDQVNNLTATLSSAQDETDYITRNYGVEGLKIRHIRTIGLREGESFTDSQPMNNRQFSFTIVPRIITKSDATFDFTARYDDQTLLDVKSVSANTYETVMLRGGRAEFGMREFIGPDGPERAPEKRALLVTITPIVQTSRSLANKPSDISRPTDQFGSKVELGESDTFEMPAILARIPLKFPEGVKLKGSITIQAIITPEGNVTNVRVLDSPDAGLNPKAIEAFRKYSFRPAKLNGRATYATFRETIVLGKEDPM